MADFTPTKSQKAAIETKGRSVLVSAAAGSGKTKVLTERLLSRIEDDADIDSFLIITFTKAAAAELKSRITDEISSRLENDPDNRRLRRQSALCQKAQIGTIHSFCAAFLRENCQAAALSPDFKVIEEDRADEIKQRIIVRVMDAAYENPTSEFLLLADSVGAGTDDSRLADLVINLHGKIQSHARPDLWAKKQIEMLNTPADDIAQTVWGKVILQSSVELAQCWAQCMDSAVTMAYSEPKIAMAYGESIAATALSLRNFCRAAADGWDRAREFLPIEFPRLNALRNSPDPELSKRIYNIRDKCRDAAKKIAKPFDAPSDKLLADMKKTAPAMKALLELTLRFDKAYTAEKRRRSEVDFADLEHLAAQLLTDEEGKPTLIARELSQRYTEIMVDEYQDVNRVQDAIFTAISKNGENLFMVGDVKQSIYRFRLADPTIFTGRYAEHAPLESAGEKMPARILLRENFRSRREIINAVNCVFKTCMSEKLGELEYNEDAQLKYGADYAGSVPVPELMLVDTAADDDDDDAPDKITAEAAAVARRIRKLVQEKTPVSDRGVMRPVRYGDIAILMRSANSAGGIYRRELAKAGVPVLGGQTGSFFTSVEVSAIICLLAVIDNPHQDIPLIAALRSPFFGFCADELSDIRAADGKADFYTALEKNARQNEKSARFVQRLNSLRECAPDMELGELLMHIYDELDVMAVCAAMTNGAEHTKRLMQLLDCAKRFESTGFKGLHRFVNWLNALAEKGEEPASGQTGDAVSIMTIHKSKGLEFPVVFLCDTNRKFNCADLRDTVLIHPQLGLGPKVTDTERKIEYNSLAKNAIALVSKREILSEEMRLLYVALTRARERLIITAAFKKPEEKVQELFNSTSFPVSPEVLMTASSPAQWLLYVLLSGTDGAINMSYYHPAGEDEQELADPEHLSTAADPELVELMRKNLAFNYPHARASELPSKVTATELKRYAEPDEEAVNLAPKKVRAFKSPDFLKDEKPLPGAQRGTATHMVLQYIDYTKAQSLDGIKAEIERLRMEKFLTDRQAQAVNAEAIEKLFSSDLGRRIMSADKLVREFKFSLLCPAERFFDGGEGEKVLLQGVIDCCIEEHGELTIIDYKTDNVKGDALYERAKTYAGQLRAYAIAVRAMTGKPVKQCALYFLNAGETVFVQEN